MTTTSRVPIPPYDLCSSCPAVARRGSQASRHNCRAYRMCIWHREKYDFEPKRFTLTRGDLVERAIGWALLGFALGWWAAERLT